MNQLHRNAMVMMPLTEETVLSFYDGSRSGTPEQCLKALCESHERLRAELQGSTALVDAAEAELALWRRSAGVSEMLSQVLGGEMTTEQKIERFRSMISKGMAFSDITDARQAMALMEDLVDSLVERLGNTVDRQELSSAEFRETVLEAKLRRIEQEAVCGFVGYCGYANCLRRAEAHPDVPEAQRLCLPCRIRKIIEESAP
jgi:hypothetical protein